MDAELTAIANDLLDIADKRNMSKDNPISFFKINNGSTFQIVVSETEPFYSNFPMNVLWVVADVDDANYGKMLRRTLKVPANGYKHTWADVTSVVDMYSQTQYWDETDTALPGEHNLPVSVVSSSDVRLGVFKLNGQAPDPTDPVVVESNDPRMSDARTPLPHSHPHLADIAISIGNGNYVTVNQSNPPSDGDVLFISGTGTNVGEYLGTWRRVTNADITFVGASLVSITPQGPTSVAQGLTAQYTALGNYSDGTINVISGTWSIVSGSAYASITSDGLLTANSTVIGHNNVILEVTYLQPGASTAITAQITVDVNDGIAQATVTGVSLINGSTSIDELTSTTYQLLATYSDGSSGVVPMSSLTVSDTAIATTDAASGTVTSTADIPADATVVVTATYIDSNATTYTATTNLTILDVTPYLSSIAIVGPVSVDENTTATYTIQATYTDNSTATVTPDTFTSSNTTVATVDPATGVLTAVTNVNTDTDTTLTATYTEGGITKSATLVVTIVDTTLYPSSAVISGATTVQEGTTSPYTLVVTYTNGYSATVSNVSWSIVNGTDATIDPATGVLTANLVTADSTVEIGASYTEAGITVTANKLITISNIVPVLQSVTVNGPTSVNGGTSANYTVTANYSDGSSADVTGTASLTVSPTTYATITAAGLLTTTDPTTNQNATITANYTESGVTKTDTLDITIVSSTSGLLPEWGYGPWEVQGNIDETFLSPILTNQLPTSNSGETFSINATGTDYVYFAHPASLGTAVFTDTATNFQGGWDSITWTTEGFGTSTGPITVTRNGVAWKVYRTDYSGIGAFTYSVSYV